MTKRPPGVKTIKDLSLAILACLGVVACLPCACFWCFFCFNPCGTKPRQHGLRCSRCHLEMPSRARSIKHQRAPRKSLAYADSIKLQSSRCGFLDLPRELRDEIYGLVLLAEGNVHLGTTILGRWTPHHWHPDIRLEGRCWFGCRIPPRALTPAVLRVSKQLHAEAAEVLYGHNTFSIDLALSRKLKRARLRHIVVRRLNLRDVLPLSPRYLPLLREMAFQPARTALGTDVPGFLEVISVLLADVPAAYMGFVRQRLGDVGAATYCSACELFREHNIHANDCFTADGTLREAYMVISGKRPGFFAGWCDTGKPKWAADVDEPVPQVSFPARTPVHLIPAPSNFGGYLKTSSQQQVALRKMSRAELPNERTLSILLSSAGWTWYWNAETAGSV